MAVRPDANAATRAAAVKWIDFYYEQPLITKPQAIRNAQDARRETKQPVGVPALPIFNKAQYDLANTWIKPYINVPQNQMKPFTTGIFEQKLIPEPAGVDAERLPLARPGRRGGAHRQEREHPDLLKQANSTAQGLISAGLDQGADRRRARVAQRRPPARRRRPGRSCLRSNVTPTATGREPAS